MKQTREHILQESFKLFLQKSYKEVTLREIVEATGLSKGAFYHHFTSKEQLFLELVNDVFSSVLDVPYDQFNQESLYHFYIDYINYYVENGEGSAPGFQYVSLIFDAIKLFPDFQKKLQELKRVQLDSWTKIVQTARSKGEISSSMSDEQIAGMFISSSSGVEMNSMLNGGSRNAGQTLLNLWNSFYNELKQA